LFETSSSVSSTVFLIIHTIATILNIEHLPDCCDNLLVLLCIHLANLDVCNLPTYNEYYFYKQSLNIHICNIQTTVDKERYVTGTCCNLCLPDILTECNKEHSIVYVTFCKYMLYASPSVQKLHSCSDIISQLYKPIFHSGHLSCNMSYGSTATIHVFHLPQWKYSYLTQSSIMELLLSVSQH